MSPTIIDHHFFVLLVHSIVKKQNFVFYVWQTQKKNKRHGKFTSPRFMLDIFFVSLHPSHGLVSFPTQIRWILFHRNKKERERKKKEKVINVIYRLVRLSHVPHSVSVCV
jgi:hypothetical protein